MDVLAVISLLQVVAFLGAALAAVWQWHRQRSRPAAYLAAAFSAIGGALLAVEAVADPHAVEPWFTMLVVAALAGFPWLLTAFAWSFAGPLPRWLWLAGLGVPALAVWAATLPFTVGADQPRTPGVTGFVVTFLALWVLLAAATVARLWRAGSRQRLVRARMHLLAVGAVLLTLVLVIGAAGGPATPAALEATTGLLSLGAVALFVAGFAPPGPLRAWWRRRSRQQFQDLQLALIATSSPEDVARAVAPMLAELLGGGVAVIDADGEVLATAQLDDDELAELTTHLLASARLPTGTSAFPVGDAWLLVSSTPYTPVFGQDELELVSTFALHLRLAFERAQLYRAEREAREQAQWARQELERALYGLSHDLKSPTVAITGFVDLLPTADSDAERDEILDHIRSSTIYLQQLVDAMLELSRVGRTQTEAATVDLEHVVTAVARRVRISHPEVTVQVEGRLPSVSMNPVRAEQMLDNLIGNAARHGGRSDVAVTLSAADRDGHLELRVADDGQGIPAGERERVFELFERGSTSGARGSGVGLGMVRRIAEAAGGSLELAEADHGACFVVSLPRDVVVQRRPDPPA